MTCLDFLLDIEPNALEDLISQCARDSVEDFPQVEDLLHDSNLSNGLHRGMDSGSLTKSLRPSRAPLCMYMIDCMSVCFP